MYYKLFNKLVMQCKKAAKTDIFDHVATLTLSTLIGFIPSFLLILFVIYHTPLLNNYQTAFEEFFFVPFSISLTEGVMHEVGKLLPSIFDFQYSTLISLLIFSYLFVFYIATTLTKITRCQYFIPLHIQIFIYILGIFAIVAALSEIFPNWLSFWWAWLLFKSISLFLLFMLLLPHKKMLGLLGIIFTAIIAQTLVGIMFIEYYTYYNNYHIIYGQFAGYIILISWIYVSWSIIALVLFFSSNKDC
tara:strand:+ start:10 stop:747 length:738 start_codon:yes stop_codon:yes gene_type:complete